MKFRLVAVMTLSVTALITMFWQMTARSDQLFVGGSSDATMSEAHQILLAKLGKRTRVDFEKVPLREMLETLSESLGTTIEIDPAGIGKDTINVQRTFKPKKPITYEAALRWVNSQAGNIRFGWTIDENGLRLIDTHHFKDRLVLQTHDLHGYSDYTTAKRRVLINQINNEVVPESWSKESGAWIAPSHSVLAIVVYNTPAVQRKVTEFYSRIHGHHPADEKRATEISKLIQPFFLKKQTVPESEKAVVELRKHYPFESLAPRLAYESKRPPKEQMSPKLSDASKERLDARNKRFPQDDKHKAFWKYRAESLRLLHEGEVKEFISREGFGLSRVHPPGPNYWHLPRSPSLPLASAEITSAIGAPQRLPATEADRLTSSLSLPSQDTLSKLHSYSEANFLTPQRFGYMKDLDHVAGFASHAITYKPQIRAIEGRPWYESDTEQWAMRRMELISLLKQDEPAVYVSDKLPKMDELSEAETRPLNAFESSSLLRLREGEDAVASATTNRIHMVGSLRAINQCKECHKVENGELLGAFSYELLRDPAIDEKAIRPAKTQ